MRFSTRKWCRDIWNTDKRHLRQAATERLPSNVWHSAGRMTHVLWMTCWRDNWSLRNHSITITITIFITIIRFFEDGFLRRPNGSIELLHNWDRAVTHEQAYCEKRDFETSMWKKTATEGLMLVFTSLVVMVVMIMIHSTAIKDPWRRDTWNMMWNSRISQLSMWNHLSQRTAVACGYTAVKMWLVCMLTCADVNESSPCWAWPRVGGHMSVAEIPSDKHTFANEREIIDLCLEIAIQYINLGITELGISIPCYCQWCNCWSLN